MTKELEKLKFDLKFYGYEIGQIKMSESWFDLFCKTSQIQKIYWHMINFEKLTTVHAQEIYGVRYPQKVIQKIREYMIDTKSPYQIVNKHKEGYDKWHNKCKFDEYTMVRDGLDVDYEERIADLFIDDWDLKEKEC